MFHDGEVEVQRRAGLEREAGRVAGSIRGEVPPVAAAFLRGRRLAVIAAADARGRPWASLLEGPPGFLDAGDGRALRVGAPPAPGDPLERALAGGERPAGLIAIDFGARRRVRVNGRARRLPEGGLLVSVDEAYSNCPKYIQAREETPLEDAPAPGPRRAGTSLDGGARRRVSCADTFFIASVHPDAGADASHRGGPPGFVRVSEDGRSLAWPDYAGNALFQTLGNVAVTGRAGLLFLDFEGEGDALQLTGRCELDWDPGAAAAFPGAQRVVRFEVEEALETPRASRLRWRFVGTSPFNP
jgi:hypothetical protein